MFRHVCAGPLNFVPSALGRNQYTVVEIELILTDIDLAPGALPSR